MELPMPQSTVVDGLETAATLAPYKPCLIFYDTVVSYSALVRESWLLAGWLQREAGVQKGDRVLLFLQNSPQFVIAFYAIAKIGGVVVPVNPMSRVEELRHFIEDSGARTMIAAQDLMEQVLQLVDMGALARVVVATYSDWLRTPTDLQLPSNLLDARREFSRVEIAHWSNVMANHIEPQPVHITHHDLCVMPYTSGTTGRPKGCMHSHRNVMFTAMAGMEWMQMTSEDIALSARPMFHVTGMQRGMTGPIALGCTMVLLTRWDATVAARLIERYKVTSWTGVRKRPAIPPWLGIGVGCR